MVAGILLFDIYFGCVYFEGTLIGCNIPFVLGKRVT